MLIPCLVAFEAGFLTELKAFSISLSNQYQCLSHIFSQVEVMKFLFPSSLRLFYLQWLTLTFVSLFLWFSHIISCLLLFYCCVLIIWFYDAWTAEHHMNSRKKGSPLPRTSLFFFFNTKRGAKFDLLCFLPFFFFLFLEDKEGCAAHFVSFSWKPYRKFLDLLIVFQLLVFFLSFTRFLWVLTSCFWTGNDLFFCSTEILDVLVGNKLSSFCLSRKLRESNRDNLEPFKIFATMV